MTIIRSLELHHRAKHRQAKKSLWLSCLRIWFWWRLSGYHITHNRGENKIPLLETLTTGSFHPWLYWKGLRQNLCYTPGQGEDDAHPHALIPLPRGRGGTHCRRHTWAGEKGRKVVWFEILLPWSHHPWFHPSCVRDTSPYRQTPTVSVTCKVSSQFTVACWPRWLIESAPLLHTHFCNMQPW